MAVEKHFFFFFEKQVLNLFNSSILSNFFFLKMPLKIFIFHLKSLYKINKKNYLNSFFQKYFFIS